MRNKLLYNLFENKMNNNFKKTKKTDIKLLIRVNNIRYENRLCSRATKNNRRRCSCCHEFIEEHEEPL